jgi:ATP-binding protein involved in chromosome partitioning
LTQKIPLTGAVIVTTPQEISVADVRRGIAMFRRVDVDILGIIENMSYFIPPDMPEKRYYIFGSGGGQSVAQENKIELLGQVPLDIRMREGNDSGTPVVFSGVSPEQKKVLVEISAHLLSQVRRHNYNRLHKPELKIQL